MTTTQKQLPTQPGAIIVEATAFVGTRYGRFDTLTLEENGTWTGKDKAGDTWVNIDNESVMSWNPAN